MASTSLLGLAARLAPAKRRAVRGAGAAMLAALLALGLAALLAGGGRPPGADLLVPGVVATAALLCLARAALIRQERAVWGLLGAGLASYAAGFVVWYGWLDDLSPPPYPSLADAFWLALYPAAWVALALLMRARITSLPAAVWLDAVVVGLSVIAVFSAFVYEAISVSVADTHAAVATSLAYPLCDALLFAFVSGFFATAGFHPGRTWLLLGLGLVTLVVADSVWINQVASGLYAFQAGPSWLWALAAALVGVAAWERRPDEEARGAAERLVTLAVPAIFTFVASGLLVWDHFERLGLITVLLAAATLLAAAARATLTLRTIRRHAETRREALTDDLTELPNRRAFYRALLETTREDRRRVAVMILDLDHFKELNDTLGHHAGDLLLQGIGPRVRRVLRAGDLLARLGGDEFAILIHNADRDSAARVAERVHAAIAEPFSVQGFSLRVEASAGIAIGGGVSAEELIKQADVAMYQAKREGSAFAFYAADRDEHSRQRLALSTELPDAIEARQLVLHYQPKYEPRSGRIPGVEALVRWQHPRRGLLAPAEFLHLASRAALMRPLTLLVLEMALERCARWRREGLDLDVAVNLAAPNVLDLQMPTDVSRLLQEHGLEPRLLVLEINETTIMADPVRAMDILEQLRELGVRLSLDDFGTGYSSLDYLRRMPVDELKVDRSFVAEMSSNVDDEAIVGSVIDLAHNLGLKVVAEGAEDAATLKRLRELGCDLVQGYHLAPPMPEAELMDWLRTRSRQPSEARGLAVPAIAI